MTTAYDRFSILLVGVAIGIVRQRHRLTQKEFGESLGHTQAWCSTVESGSRMPSVVDLQRMSKRYGLQLVNGSWLVAPGLPGPREAARDETLDSAGPRLSYDSDTGSYEQGRGTFSASPSNRWEPVVLPEVTVTGLPPLASCLVCGHREPLAVWKDGTDVGVCGECRDARVRLASATEALRDVRAVLEDEADWDISRNFARIEGITARALAAAGTPPES